MDFKTASKLGSLLAKDYAEDIFELLVNYQAISASEVAARLGLHIKTSQDFLESLAELGILSATEVYEKKRPYLRYALIIDKINFEIDLRQIIKKPQLEELSWKVREKENNGARFVVVRSADAINSVSIWMGEGRDRQERNIKLTPPQGKFLFHLPFPKAGPLTIAGIMQKAGIDASLAPEILDLVQLLQKYNVIERSPLSVE